MGNYQEKIEDAVVPAYVEEYNELLATWRDLERKAQNTVALAGVLLGGALAFVRNIGASTDSLEKFLLTATVGLLSMSLLSCWFVLRTRWTPGPPSGKYIEKLATDLLKLKAAQLTNERYAGFIVNQAVKWNTVNRAIYKANLEKASHLQVGQFFVVASLAVVAITAIVNIFKEIAP